MLILAIFGNIIINNYSNKSNAYFKRISIILLVILLFCFYKYVYADTSNVWQFIFLQLRIYFLLTIAFVNG